MITEEQFVESFRKKAESGLKLWDCPSVSVGVIKDGRVVLCEGYGLRDVDKKLPATGQTLYQIGSCSKAFTSALVAIMVDRGKLSWDKPIVEYLPEMKFYEDYATSHLTLRDMLCHRSGLPRHEYAWYGTNFTKAELMHNLRYLEPNQSLRSGFQYNNFGYIAAGYAVERITGKSWEDCISEYLLEPLGMKRSNMFVDCIRNDPNHATPYDRTDPATAPLIGIREIPFYKMPVEDYSKRVGAPLGPAGAINSSAEEMLKWVNFHLNNGQVNGRQLISKDSINQMHNPNMLLSNAMDITGPESDFYCYGLGWFINSFRGHKLIHHGGSINGFKAFTGFIPELNLGIVAYNNMNDSYLVFALAKEIIDYYLGVECGNWVERYHKYYREKFDDRNACMKTYVGKQILGTCPSHPLKDYVGIYTRNGYNPVEIIMEGGQLALHMAGVVTKLQHYHYDTFVTSDIVGELPPKLPAFFRMRDAGGQICRIALPLVPEAGGALICFDKQL